MHRFRRILVCPAELSAGDPAVATATDLAARTGADLTVVWTNHPSQSAAAHGQLSERRLDALLAAARDRGVRAIGQRLSGRDPASLVVKQVARRRIDLVIKTARAGAPPRRGPFGSIAKTLLRTCPCPVWIVRECNAASRIILAAVAPYHYREQLERMDRAVIEVARQLAHVSGATLHVVSAWEALGVQLMSHPGYHRDLAGYIKASERDARRALLRFLDPFGIRSRRIHIRNGRAGSAIAAVAEELSAQLVVVGAAGRTGLRRWLLGNTVDDVVDESVPALLGVRPHIS